MLLQIIAWCVLIDDESDPLPPLVGEKLHAVANAVALVSNQPIDVGRLQKAVANHIGCRRQARLYGLTDLFRLINGAHQYGSIHFPLAKQLDVSGLILFGDASIIDQTGIPLARELAFNIIDAIRMLCSANVRD